MRLRGHGTEPRKSSLFPPCQMEIQKSKPICAAGITGVQFLCRAALPAQRSAPHHHRYAECTSPRSQPSPASSGCDNKWHTGAAHALQPRAARFPLRQCPAVLRPADTPAPRYIIYKDSFVCMSAGFAEPRNQSVPDCRHKTASHRAFQSNSRFVPAKPMSFHAENPDARKKCKT